jgi:hypothetical protein
MTPEYSTSRKGIGFGKGKHREHLIDHFVHIGELPAPVLQKFLERPAHGRFLAQRLQRNIDVRCRNFGIELVEEAQGNCEMTDGGLHYNDLLHPSGTSRDGAAG